MALNGNLLGDELKAGLMPLVNALNQASDPTEAEAYQTALFRKQGNIIVDHIINNIVVGSLSTTSTPTDGPGHIHNPITVAATGKIS